jgi:lysophospholipase L1-like esterase
MKKLLCISALLALVGSCFAEPVRIVAYGDSITHGWIPNSNPPSTRYGPDDRWPGALQKELGDNYQVIEEGLDGRTTDARDPGSPISGAQLDGSAYLQACLASHLPVDLVVIMLGSNDLKPVFNRTPLRIAIGAARLIDLACFNRWSRRFTPHVRIREKARSCRCREGEGDFEVDIPCPADRPVYGRCFRRLTASSPAGTVSNKARLCRLVAATCVPS